MGGGVGQQHRHSAGGGGVGGSKYWNSLVYCMVATMAAWVPVALAVLVVCLVAAAFALARTVVARFLRRVRVRRGKINAHPDSAFIAATKLIKHGDLVVLRRSFASGLNGDLQDKWGNDLLIVAANTGNVAVGDLIIANGADVNRVAPSGYAAVWAALYGGHIRFLELLFKHGADPDRRWGNRTIEEELQRCQFDPKKAEAVRALLRVYRAGQHSSS
jgi:hypothetical protein